MTRVYLEGIGVWGPAMPGWPACRALLAGADAPAALDYADPPAERLSPQERRRSIATVRLAVEVATQACATPGRDAADYATVFASSAGDLATLDAICTVLARDPRLLSPTRFHNSVHNAPGGYWSIVSGCQRASNSLAAGADSFAAGLLEAAVQCVGEQVPTLLVAYDLPGPEPLQAVAGISHAFAVALALSPTRGAGSQAVLTLDYRAGAAGASTLWTHPGLDALYLGNPAARGLPLLAALARGATGQVDFSLAGGGCLGVGVLPAD